MHATATRAAFPLRWSSPTVKVLVVKAMLFLSDFASMSSDDGKANESMRA